MAGQQMLKFVTVGKQMPQKRDAETRSQDFDEIYRQFAAEKAAEQAGLSAAHIADIREGRPVSLAGARLTVAMAAGKS